MPKPRRPYASPAVLSTRPWVYAPPSVLDSVPVPDAVIAMLTGAALPEGSA